MMKNKYSKDNIYLRNLEREKVEQRIKDTNKQLRRYAYESKQRMK